MSHSMNQIQNQIISEFQSFKSWEDKYTHLIALGKGLAPLDEEFKTETFKVKGCQSQVWLKADFKDNQKISFLGDSDALIVKGLVSLLLRVFNDQSPKDILETDLYFIDKIELSNHLSVSRTNGLNSMIKQIKYYAQAFYILSQR
jgi:cysteine desulfuration protein SufE